MRTEKWACFWWQYKNRIYYSASPNYYYRFAQVRKACLEQIKNDKTEQKLVQVQTEQLKKETPSSYSSLELNINGIVVRVTESTSEELLKKVLRVTVNVK